MLMSLVWVQHLGTGILYSFRMAGHAGLDAAFILHAVSK